MLVTFMHDMLRYLIIDDESCKADLAKFLQKHKKSVKLNVEENGFLSRTERLMKLARKTGESSRILVSSSDTLNLLDVSSIVRCESSRNYTTLYLSNSKNLVASKTLMDFENLLQQHNFLRIHKSHLVNVAYIERYVKAGGGYIILRNGEQLPVAIRKREYLFRKLVEL
jgi:two-component system LytT family response regulator